MNTGCHVQMVWTALAGKISPEALEWIAAANRRADDLYDHIPERHFDNAANREAIRCRWQRGLNRYLTSAVKLAGPKTIGRWRKRALQSFGYATHAIQDFYAHTNWVEIHIAKGVQDALAPLTTGVFVVEAYPEDLASGFYSPKFGKTGCPEHNGEFHPPHPFQFCHEQIAKDNPDKNHGADIAASDGKTYYEIAVTLATRSTAKLWEAYQERIIAKYNSPELLQQLAWGKAAPQLQEH